MKKAFNTCWIKTRCLSSLFQSAATQYPEHAQIIFDIYENEVKASLSKKENYNKTVEAAQKAI